MSAAQKCLSLSSFPFKLSFLTFNFVSFSIIFINHDGCSYFFYYKTKLRIILLDWFPVLATPVISELINTVQFRQQ